MEPTHGGRKIDRKAETISPRRIHVQRRYLEEGEADVAATEMKDRRAAMFLIHRAVLLVMVRYVGEVSFAEQVRGIFHDLEDARHHCQGEQEATDLGAPCVHHPTIRQAVPMGSPIETKVGGRWF